MPNRIIKESICTSEKLAALTDFEFRLWIGLILVVDDAGRGDARAAVLRGRIFPLRERVSVKDVESALHGLAAKGCISLYTVGGKSYFWFPTWTKHQRIRDCKPKYPGPEESDCQPAATCGDLPQAAATCGDLPQAAAIIQSEYESQYSCPEREQPASGPAAILLPLNTGQDFAVTDEQVKEWQSLYPAVDVMQQLRCMRGWLQSNPKKRKTAQGILRFVNGWLAKEQDRGGTPPDSTPRQTGAAWRAFDEQ